MAVTYAERLAKAMAADAHEGTEHRGDAVLFEMLGIVGRRARGELPDPALERQDRETRQILKSQQLARANRMLAARAGASQAARSAGGQGAGSLKPQKPVTRPLVKSAPAAQRQHRADAKVQAAAGARSALGDDAKVKAAAALGGAMTPAQAEAAIDAAVVAGRISGTEAVALLERIKRERGG